MVKTLDATTFDAGTLEAGTLDAGTHDVVYVHSLGLAHATAACTCGWSGRRRILRAAAEQDAWLHAMAERCQVASPLVLTW